jgi:hypothetical protein
MTGHPTTYGLLDIHWSRSTPSRCQCRRISAAKQLASWRAPAVRAEVSARRHRKPYLPRPADRSVNQFRTTRIS